jgi:prevent-host-death family protein
MSVVPLSEAKNNLSALINRVEAGEDVEISRRGRVVARVTRPDAEQEARSQAERVDEAYARLKQLTAGIYFDDSGKPLSVEELKAIAREGLD